MRKAGFKPYFQRSQKKIKIWLLSLVWIFFSFSWFSYANTYNNCSLFTQGKVPTIIANLRTDPIVSKWAIPLQAIEKALDNLHSYCCSSEILSKTTKSCIESKNNRQNNAYVPESAALFDQFVDVQMRRWTNDLNNYSGVPADQQFQNWHTKIKETMLDPKWTLPQTFLASYPENRSYNDQHLLPRYIDHSAQDFRQAIRDSSALTNATSRNLRSKLLNTCSIASYLTAILDAESKTMVPDLTKANPLCTKLINQEINKQINLLSRVITYKSNKATTDSIENYALNYFWSRLRYLQTQIDKLNTQLLSTSRQIPYLVPKCN